MRQKLVMLAVTLYIATLAPSADAHHSHPYFYDECKSVTIEGRVERVEFKDPHTWIFLRLDDGTMYTVDWAPLSRLTKQGVIGPAKGWSCIWLVLRACSAGDGARQKTRHHDARRLRAAFDARFDGFRRDAAGSGVTSCWSSASDARSRFSTSDPSGVIR